MRTPSLASVLAATVKQQQSEIRVALPARVESFDAVKQSVNVQPLIGDSRNDEQRERQPQKLPVLVNVPVIYPGAGEYRITWPIAVGSTVLLVFSSSSLDTWLAVGGEVDPGDDRRHNLNDAIAIPGLHDFAHVPTTAPTDAMVMHAAKLQLGGPGATDPIVRKSDLDAVVSGFNDRLVGHTHSGVTTGGGISGSGVVTTIPALVPSPACSPKVTTE